MESSKVYLFKKNSVYYLQYKDTLGIDKQVSTKVKTKTDALDFLRNFNSEEHHRKLIIQRKFLNDFRDDYYIYSKSVHTPNTAEVYQSAFREFERVIGNLPMQSIGIREIERFLAIKKETTSEWTARRCYISLASAFEKAKSWNLIMENPFRKVKKPKTREITPLYMTVGEFQKLLKVIADPDFKDLCIAAFLTGMRSGELRSLQWKDIDFVNRTVFVQNGESFTTKTKRNRIIPLNDLLFNLLLKKKDKLCFESAYIFNSRGTQYTKDFISKRFKQYVKLTELNQKLHFHSLRHSFASNLVGQGASIYEIQKFLGHSSITVTQIYSHLQPEQRHSTVNKIQISLN